MRNTCTICKKFISHKKCDFYKYIKIEICDGADYKFEYIHHQCFDELSFEEKMTFVNDCATTGDIPLHKLFHQLNNVYKDLKRRHHTIILDMEDLKDENERLVNLVKWHKFPEMPNFNISNQVYITLRTSNKLVRCICNNDGSFCNAETNETIERHNIVAWAYRLKPKIYNDMCYDQHILKDI